MVHDHVDEIEHGRLVDEPLNVHGSRQRREVSELALRHRRAQRHQNLEAGLRELSCGPDEQAAIGEHRAQREVGPRPGRGGAQPVRDRPGLVPRHGPQVDDIEVELGAGLAQELGKDLEAGQRQVVEAGRRGQPAVGVLLGEDPAAVHLGEHRVGEVDVRALRRSEPGNRLGHPVGEAPAGREALHRRHGEPVAEGVAGGDGDLGAGLSEGQGQRHHRGRGARTPAGRRPRLAQPDYGRESIKGGMGRTLV